MTRKRRPKIRPSGAKFRGDHQGMIIRVTNEYLIHTSGYISTTDAYKYKGDTKSHTLIHSDAEVVQP